MNYLATFNTETRQFVFTRFDMQWNPKFGKPLTELVNATPETIVVGLFCERNGAIWIKPPVSVQVHLASSINAHLRNGFTVVCPLGTHLCLVQDFTTKVVDAWEKFNTI